MKLCACLLFLLALLGGRGIFATEADSSWLGLLANKVADEMRAESDRAKSDAERKQDQTRSADATLRKEEHQRLKQADTTAKREAETKKEEDAAAAKRNNDLSKTRLAEGREKLREERQQKRAQNESNARVLTEELKDKDQQERDRDERAREKLRQESGK